MAGMKKTKKMAKRCISAVIAKFKGKNGGKKMRGGGLAIQGLGFKGVR